MSIPVDQGWTHLWRALTAAHEVLAELHRAPIDEAACVRVVEAHHRVLVEAGSVLSEDLKQELQHLIAPFEDHELTNSEALIAQAQLVGWLTGLMEGLRTGLVEVHQESLG